MPVGLRRRQRCKFLVGRPAGAAVTVHYKPDDPKTATLSTSSQMADWRFKMDLGITGFGIAVLVIFYVIISLPG